MFLIDDVIEFIGIFTGEPKCNPRRTRQLDREWKAARVLERQGRYPYQLRVEDASGRTAAEIADTN